MKAQTLPVLHVDSPSAIRNCASVATMQRVPFRVLSLIVFLLLVLALFLARRWTMAGREVISSLDYSYEDAGNAALWSSDRDSVQLFEPQDKQGGGGEGGGGRREGEGQQGGVDEFYGVMFDAGSTGSRVHVFRFRENPQGIPILLSEVFNYTSLPLAKYADNPPEGAVSLSSLLHVALSSIPSSQWAATPVALKATAGLRLLPEDKARTLLHHVHSMFEGCPLHVETQEHSVGIMEGTDEGIFMWVTVNFLNGALIHSRPIETIGTLDMGGGSTQVTFLPQRAETLQHPVHRDFIKNYPFLHYDYKLYTKSYLGLGLRAARLEILTREKKNHIFNFSSAAEESDPEWFASVCLPPEMSGSWEFGGMTYSASSSNQRSESVYENCLSIVKAFVTDTVIAPEEMQDSASFYALSYFWERAAEIGKVDWKDGGELLVKDYREAAIDVCLNPEVYADKPFHCMDLVYLSSMLSHGYKFGDDVRLLMTNKIRDFEVSWALGATLDLLRMHWEHARRR